MGMVLLWQVIVTGKMNTLDITPSKQLLCSQDCHLNLAWKLPTKYLSRILPFKILVYSCSILLAVLCSRFSQRELKWQIMCRYGTGGYDVKEQVTPSRNALHTLCEV